MTAADVVQLVLRHPASAEVALLDDESRWAGAVQDERFVVPSRH